MNTGLMNTRSYLHEVKISFFFSSVRFVVCIQQSDLFRLAQHQYTIINTLVLAKTNVLMIVCRCCAETEWITLLNINNTVVWLLLKFVVCSLCNSHMARFQHRNILNSWKKWWLRCHYVIMYKRKCHPVHEMFYVW